MLTATAAPHPCNGPRSPPQVLSAFGTVIVLVSDPSSPQKYFGWKSGQPSDTITPRSIFAFRLLKSAAVHFWIVGSFESPTSRSQLKKSPADALNKLPLSVVSTLPSFIFSGDQSRYQRCLPDGA